MDPELFKQMQEAAERFRSGESDYEELMTPNGLAVIVRDTSDPRGFRIDFVGDGAKRSVKEQSYPAVPRRPPGYPAPLPFLPGCAAIVDTATQSVRWDDPEDPEAAFEHVSRECTGDGWVETELDTDGLESAEPRRGFAKDGTQRLLRLSVAEGKTQLVLTEHEESAGAG